MSENPKEVSEEHLKNVLHDLHMKHEADRREQGEAINKALSDGFRCGPRSPSIEGQFEKFSLLEETPTIATDHTEMSPIEGQEELWREVLELLEVISHSEKRAYPELMKRFTITRKK